MSGDLENNESFEAMLNESLNWMQGDYVILTGYIFL